MIFRIFNKFFLGVFASTLFFFFSCVGDSGSSSSAPKTNFSEPKINRLEMEFFEEGATEEKTSFPKGNTVQILVRAILTDGSKMDVSDQVTFSENFAGVIFIDNVFQKITTIAAGNAQVTAKYLNRAMTDSAGEKSITQSIAITPPEIKDVEIIPSIGELILKDRKQTLEAFYIYTDNTKSRVSDVSSWTVNSPVNPNFNSAGANQSINSTSTNSTPQLDFPSDSTGNYIVEVNTAGGLSAEIEIEVTEIEDTTKPVVNLSIPLSRTVASTGPFDIPVRVSATDDRKLSGYYLTTDGQATPPLSNSSDWIRPSSFPSPTDTNFKIEKRPDQDYMNITVYAWVKDAAGNISDRSSDQILVIHAIDYNNSDNQNPLIQSEWYLKNIGQNAYSKNHGIQEQDLNVQNVHNRYGFKGKGVKIAVVDDGLELDHEDLKTNILSGRSHLNYRLDYLNSNTSENIQRRYDPSPEFPKFDDNEGSHGSSVAGIIAMRDNNKIGGSGIAPQANLMGINFLSYQSGWAYYANSLGMYPSSDFSKNANIFSCDFTTSGKKSCQEKIKKYQDGMTGTKPQEADIFNMSFGFYSVSLSGSDESVEMIYRYGAKTLRSGLGAIYIKSAGNAFEFFEDGDNVYACSFYKDGIIAGRSTSTSINSHSGIFFDNLNSSFKPCHNTNNEADNLSPYILLIAANNAEGNNASYSSSGANIWITGTGGEEGIDEPAMVTVDRSGCGYGYDANEDNSDFNKNTNVGGQNAECNYTNTFNGTSSAAPSISGIVALMLEANPKLTWLDVKHILAATAYKPDLSQIKRTDITMNVNGENFTSYKSRSWEGNTSFNGGFNNNFGWGIADAEAAIKMALDPNYQSLGNSLIEESQSYVDVNQPIPDFNTAGVISRTGTTSTGIQNSKIRFISVDVDMEHEMLAEVTIKLVNTTHNIESTLYWAGSGLVVPVSSGTAFRATTNAFYDLDYSDTDQWELRIYDTLRSKQFQKFQKNLSRFLVGKTYDKNGTFKRWRLTFYLSPGN